MAAPTLNLPRLRLTRPAKVLLVIAAVVMLTAPVTPAVWRALHAPKPAEMIESGLSCDGPHWPAQSSLVTVTEDLGAGATVSRPGVMITGQRRVVYLCTAGGAR